MHRPTKEWLSAGLLALAMPLAALAQIDQELQDYVNSLSGLEAAGAQFDFEVQGINTTVELVGFGFCLPSDPTLPPVAPPTAPNNVYGCVNDVTVAGTPVADPPGMDLLLSADRLFLDLVTTRDRTFLCGDIGGGTRTEDAYATLHFSLSGNVRFVEQDGCIRWVSTPGSADLTVGALEFDFDDPCLQTYAGLVAGSVLSLLEGQLETLIVDAVEAFLHDRNLTTCGVAVLPVNWAALKARFDTP